MGEFLAKTTPGYHNSSFCRSGIVKLTDEFTGVSTSFVGISLATLLPTQSFNAEAGKAWRISGDDATIPLISFNAATFTGERVAKPIASAPP